MRIYGEQIHLCMCFPFPVAWKHTGDTTQCDWLISQTSNRTRIKPIRMNPNNWLEDIDSKIIFSLSESSLFSLTGYTL